MIKNQKLTIGIVAGESSGDALGADFMQQAKLLNPNIRWVGVGGEQMQNQGLTSIIKMERLSVMGLIEVLKHLPDLLKAKTEILSTFLQEKIDIFIGIDAPDFNLRLAKSLKPKGVFCVQYVSPSVWAWRESRIHDIKQATDLVLCLFPFELDVYKKHKHPAICVGHPLLKKLSANSTDLFTLRKKFQLIHQDKQTTLFNFNYQKTTLCIMSGSRISEITNILPLLLESITIISKHLDCQFLLPVVNQNHADLALHLCQKHASHLLERIFILSPKVHDCQKLTLSQHCMNVSDIILLASGTATLEAMLLHRPMVVVYKVNTLTYHLAKHLIKIPFVSLPNILSHQQNQTAIVPELIQNNAKAEIIAEQAINILQNPLTIQSLLATTTEKLRQDSHACPATTVLDCFNHQGGL